MRWLLVAILVAGCGVTDTADVWTTVVDVHLTPGCSDPDTCYETIELYPFCGETFPFIEDDTRELTAVTSHDPDDVTGLVQLRYTGAVSVADSYRAHVDYVLGAGDETYGVQAAYADYDAPPLYRLDGEGRASDVDLTKLSSVEGSTMRFVYGDVVEDHTVKPPRKITVETEDPPPCCSAGRPLDLGVVFALVLFPWRRRRKLRA